MMNLCWWFLLTREEDRDEVSLFFLVTHVVRVCREDQVPAESSARNVSVCSRVAAASLWGSQTNLQNSVCFPPARLSTQTNNGHTASKRKKTNELAKGLYTDMQIAREILPE